MIHWIFSECLEFQMSCYKVCYLEARRRLPKLFLPRGYLKSLRLITDFSNYFFLIAHSMMVSFFDPNIFLQEPRQNLKSSWLNYCQLTKPFLNFWGYSLKKILIMAKNKHKTRPLKKINLFKWYILTTSGFFSQKQRPIWILTQEKWIYWNWGLPTSSKPPSIEAVLSNISMN